MTVYASAEKIIEKSKWILLNTLRKDLEKKVRMYLVAVDAGIPVVDLLDDLRSILIAIDQVLNPDTKWID